MRVVYLVGFRGAGKTSLGQLLQREGLGECIDLDQQLEQRLGMPLLQFYEQKGEPAFREEEAKLLAEIEARFLSENTLKSGAPLLWVATGGGIVEGEKSLKILATSKAPRIYLELEAEELWERLQGQPERLRWGGLVDLKSVKSLLERRRPLYEEIASRKLPNRDIHKTLAWIKEWVLELGQNKQN